MERMVGLFLQPLPVRARLTAGESFADLALRMQQDAGDSEPFQHLPLAEMQRLDGKRRTLFDHVLVFENYPLASDRGDGARPSSLSGSGPWRPGRPPDVN